MVSGLRRISAAAWLWGSRLRMPPGAWMLMLCVVSKVKKAKCMKDKELNTDEVQSIVNTKKERNPPGA